MLHELAPPENRNVLCRQRKPFAILAPIVKPPVPIAFDPGRIIRLDRMDEIRSLGKLDGEFAFPSAGGIRAANFVEAPGLEQIHEAKFCFRNESDAQESNFALDRLEWRLSQEHTDPTAPHALALCRQKLIWERWPEGNAAAAATVDARRAA